MDPVPGESVGGSRTRSGVEFRGPLAAAPISISSSGEELFTLLTTPPKKQCPPREVGKRKAGPSPLSPLIEQSNLAE